MRNKRQRELSEEERTEAWILLGKLLAGIEEHPWQHGRKESRVMTIEASLLHFFEYKTGSQVAKETNQREERVAEMLRRATFYMRDHTRIEVYRHWQALPAKLLLSVLGMEELKFIADPAWREAKIAGGSDE